MTSFDDFDDLDAPTRPRPPRRKAPATVGPGLLVLHIERGRATVLGADGPFDAELTRDLAGRQRTDLAVGDFVRLDPRGRIAETLPRRSSLARPDPGDRVPRTLVANVDLVVIVASVVAPPLRPRLVDRIGLAATRGGCRVAVAVNKIDLLGDDRSVLEAVDESRTGFPVVPVSVVSGEGLEELRSRLRGKLSAFVGHSGVGKSSLLKALLGFDVATGAVSGGNGRGAHTTRGSTLYDTGDGTRIIDTPGVRAFGLGEVDDEDRNDAFPEIAALACRFRDCAHVGEPGCGLPDALADGRVTEARLDAWRRLR